MADIFICNIGTSRLPEGFGLKSEDGLSCDIKMFMQNIDSIMLDKILLKDNVFHKVIQYSDSIIR